MGELGGFMKYSRDTPTRRPVEIRLKDWKEVYNPFPVTELKSQAARCMDCGIPFCNNGCPLGNLIPEWNELVRAGQWSDAIERLHATNNFPEFTGRLCPAPCEGACVLGINEDPVAIKVVENTIIDTAWDNGHVKALPALTKTGKRVAVVGSGPAGLAAAQQLTRAGHAVTVYERAERIGGLLRYGIPEFKMEKWVLDRRLAQMEEEGTRFIAGSCIGQPGHPSADDLRAEYDAVVLAGGSTQARDLPVPGRDLAGVHYAMEYLTPSNKVQEGDLGESPITATGKHVVIIGGGDTGADCLGTAHRQGAASVHQFEIMPKPPEGRDGVANPWPLYPYVYRVSSAHEEGGERVYSVTTTSFEGDDGVVQRLLGHQVEMVGGRFEKVEGSDFVMPADLVLLAMGFVGPERGGLLQQFGVELDGRGNVARRDDYSTSVEGVFVAGDMGRGQSLIVWAIAEGRSAAACVDALLMGDTLLPAPLSATPTLAKSSV